MANQSTDDTQPEDAKLKEALDYLTHTAPREETKQALCGWDPSVFDLAGRAELLSFSLSNSTCPSLVLSLDHFDEKPTAHFDESYFGGSIHALVRVHIAAASSKLAVLDAIDIIRREIVQKWESLITNPNPATKELKRHK